MCQWHVFNKGKTGVKCSEVGIIFEAFHLLVSMLGKISYFGLKQKLFIILNFFVGNYIFRLKVYFSFTIKVSNKNLVFTKNK